MGRPGKAPRVTEHNGGERPWEGLPRAIRPFGRLRPTLPDRSARLKAPAVDDQVDTCELGRCLDDSHPPFYERKKKMWKPYDKKALSSLGQQNFASPVFPVEHPPVQITLHLLSFARSPP
jgi:hypothetical protein